MDALASWVDGNWFNVIQTVGIIGSLWLATGAANWDARAKEIENLLSLSEHHRELWKAILSRKDLERVLQSDANVLLTPPTVAEMEFLNLVIVHFQTGWWIARAGGMTTLKEMKTDIRDFSPSPCLAPFGRKLVIIETASLCRLWNVRFAPETLSLHETVAGCLYDTTKGITRHARRGQFDHRPKQTGRNLSLVENIRR